MTSVWSAEPHLFSKNLFKSPSDSYAMATKYEQQRAAAFMRATGIDGVGLVDQTHEITYGLAGVMGTDWRISFDFSDRNMEVQYLRLVAHAPEELVANANIIRRAQSFAVDEGWQSKLSVRCGSYVLEVYVAVKGRCRDTARIVGVLDDIISDGLNKEMPQRTLRMLSEGIKK